MLKKILKRLASKATYQVGELYTIPLNGEYGIFKVLKVEERGVHVCLYSNLYEKTPSKIDISELYIDENKISGSNHTPLHYSSLKLWRPSYLQDAEVEKEELYSYHNWRENPYFI